MVRGPEIRKGQRLGPSGIADVAPTLLHLLGIPIPQDMDGKVLQDLFEPGSPMAQRKIQWVAPSGLDVSVNLMIRERFAAEIGGMRPGRVLSLTMPSMPDSAYLLRQRPTLPTS